MEDASTVTTEEEPNKTDKTTHKQRRILPNKPLQSCYVLDFDKTCGKLSLTKINTNEELRNHPLETNIYVCQQLTSSASLEEHFQCETLSEL